MLQHDMTMPRRRLAADAAALPGLHVDGEVRGLRGEPLVRKIINVCSISIEIVITSTSCCITTGIVSYY